MDNQDIVRDDEGLYRRVPAELKGIAYSVVNGQFKILPAAFRDRALTPSVYRVELINHDANLPQEKVEDGVVEITTIQIRQIGSVVTKDEGQVIKEHSVDVIADPVVTTNSILLDSAHALIVVNPKYFGSKNKQRNTFDLLKIALSTLANENGWIIEPTPPQSNSIDS